MAVLPHSTALQRIRSYRLCVGLNEVVAATNGINQSKYISVFATMQKSQLLRLTQRKNKHSYLTAQPIMASSKNPNPPSLFYLFI